jgi:spore photoproduct lyase
LEAAQKVIRSGYRVGFHFDPVIDYPGWEKDYEEVLSRLFETLPQEKIAWISLGCLRFMPELKTIMQDRFPKSKLPLAEWITGMDGKLRYDKLRRIEIYSKMTEMIRRQAPDVTLYLTMESAEVWRRVSGKEVTKETVCGMLDQAGRT